MRFPPITTSRLELISLGPPFLEALLGSSPGAAERIGGFSLPRGWPDDHDRRFLALRLNQMGCDPQSQQWLVRAMISRQDQIRLMIGHIGFHGPPRDGVVEIGYTVFERFRQRGYATEAIQGLMRWAHEEHGISRFRVSISPDNTPSLAMAAKLGFEQTGEQVDPEDGLEYVFERDYTPGAVE